MQLQAILPACLSALLTVGAITPLVCTTTAIAAPQSVTNDDEITRYLRSRDLDVLLAAELEERLGNASGPLREDIILELADVYIRLLRKTDDPEENAELEERGNRLIATAPSDSVDRLRLALLRGPFRKAEEIAQRHRMYSTQPDEIEEARVLLLESVPELERLYDRFDDRLRSMQRTFDQSPRGDVDKLAKRKAEFTELRMQAAYLTGWSMYYLGWLSDQTDISGRAQYYFGQVLDADNPYIEPADVSEDLRELEYVARTILGMALATSHASSASGAVGWLDLLAHHNTFKPLREEYDVWNMIIHLEHEDFSRVLNMLNASRDDQGQLPLTWVRIAAVQALSVQANDVDAAVLSRFAIAELASMGELDHVLDLADRFGRDALGDRGFAMHYVSGALNYRDARALHNTDYATADPEALSYYAAAGDEFAKALDEDDAQDFPAAAAGAQRLIGYCYYFQGQFLEAREALVAASRELPGEEAAEALWMAIVALEKVVQNGGDEKIESDMLALIDRFLDEFPSSQYAPKLIIRRSLAESGSQAVPAQQTIKQLLSVPPNSDVYQSARRRAAWLLFQEYRAHNGGERVSLGNEYLGVALPLLNPDDPDVAVDDVKFSEQMQRARRILEVALGRGIERTVAAETALNAIDVLRDIDSIAIADYRDEILYREMRLAVFSGNGGEAAAISDELWTNDPTSSWAIQAARTLFKEAFDERSARTKQGHSDADILPLVVRYGNRVLSEYSDRPEALNDRAVLSYHMAIASATYDFWKQTGDINVAKDAYRLFGDVLLTHAPSNGQFLRYTGLLAEDLENPSRALECWRKISAGARQSTTQWFEARFHIIDLLATLEPERARQVLEQHKVLYPDYGPTPWGPRLKAVEARLNGSAQTSNPQNHSAKEVIG